MDFEDTSIRRSRYLFVPAAVRRLIEDEGRCACIREVKYRRHCRHLHPPIIALHCRIKSAKVPILVKTCCEMWRLTPKKPELD